MAKVVEKPGKPTLDGSPVRLSERDHDYALMNRMHVRDCVKEVPVRGEENGSRFLCHVEDTGVYRALMLGSPNVKDNMTEAG